MKCPLNCLFVAGLLASLTTVALAQSDEIGRREYLKNCGSCHGETGKGDGPASEALRTRPSDLTVLTKNNDGVFPAQVLYQIVDGRKTLRAHGNYEMPVWGSNLDRERILAIRDYLLSLQSK
jgi:mono/diheme cytochrome c family protein